MSNDISEKTLILIIDDSPTNLGILSKYFETSGFEMRIAESGEEGLRQAERLQPDIILSDIMMPGINGFETCERLKENESTRDIPVIFMTSLSEVSNKIKGFDVGAVDYITKPFRKEELLARVNTHLTLRRLRKRLEEKNGELSKALEQLKSAQHQLILREKMAALGHLIAGIAHEINTPLGAIRASISNISNALKDTMFRLPELFHLLSPQQRADFSALVQEATANMENLSSKDARKIRRALREESEMQGIGNAETIADMLATMGVYRNIGRFHSLLKANNNTFILQAAYSLFVQQSNSSNIARAVDRASKIVFALKSYARHDASDKKIHAKITEGIEVVLTLYHNQLKQGTDVVTDYQSEASVLCYPDELNQVWTNLIHNAIYAMNGKGQLKIEVSDKDDWVAVRITDSGTGISEDIKDRIFEPFFTTKPAGEGSGLGLDIVKKIIERHDGKISVESQPGNTTFEILLPK